MYILKDQECERCKSEVIVRSFVDPKTKVMYADYGECPNCEKRVIMPGDIWKEALNQGYMIRK